MMNAKTLLVLSGVACGACVAAAKPPLQMAPAGARLEPIAMQAAILRADGSIQMIGELVPYEASSGRTNFNVAFDCHEADLTGVPTDGADCGGYDPVCIESCSSERYFFGSSYFNKYFANDMTVAPRFVAPARPYAEGLAFAWYHALDDPNFQVGVWGAQSFSDDCAGFDTDGDGIPDAGATDLYEGIIYTFGPVGASGGGYYYTLIDLHGAGAIQEISLAPGSYVIKYIGDDDHDGIPDRPATCGQPMLWGTAKAGNQSHQGSLQWDDDNPADGVHSAPDECYNYDFAFCMEPLGAMMAFYVDEPICYADCDINGEINTLDFLCYLNQFGRGDPAADCNGDGHVDTTDFLCFLNIFNEGC